MAIRGESKRPRGEQMPTKYPMPVGPNYLYWGEQVGFIYNPWTDQYVPDPEMQQDFAEEHGLAEKTEKPPGALETAAASTLPVAATAAGAYGVHAFTSSPTAVQVMANGNILMSDGSIISGTTGQTISGAASSTATTGAATAPIASPASSGAGATAASGSTAPGAGDGLLALSKEGGTASTQTGAAEGAGTGAAEGSGGASSSASGLLGAAAIAAQAAHAVYRGYKGWQKLKHSEGGAKGFGQGFKDGLKTKNVMAYGPWSPFVFAPMGLLGHKSTKDYQRERAGALREKDPSYVNFETTRETKAPDIQGLIELGKSKTPEGFKGWWDNPETPNNDWVWINKNPLLADERGVRSEEQVAALGSGDVMFQPWFFEKFKNWGNLTMEQRDKIAAAAIGSGTADSSKGMIDFDLTPDIAKAAKDAGVELNDPEEKIKEEVEEKEEEEETTEDLGRKPGPAPIDSNSSIAQTASAGSTGQAMPGPAPLPNGVPFMTEEEKKRAAEEALRRLGR